MLDTSTSPRSLEQILKACSNMYFSQKMKETPLTIHSRDEEGDTPLHLVLWRNDTQAALQLIEAGANVNAVGSMSETPLDVAMAQQNTVAIKALLKSGAKKNNVSEFGVSPQDLAKELGGDIQRLFG